MPQQEIEVILVRQLASYLAMPIFIVDPAGTLLYYNEPAESILGRRFEETGAMAMAEWSTIFEPLNDAGEPILPRELPLAIALAERRPTHRRFWIQGLDLVQRHIEVTSIPLIGQANRYLGAMAIFWVGIPMMRVTLWGTRGSLASPGPETARYGGNTACVEVAGADGAVLVLDAGTGIRRLGAALPKTLRRIDILLTHLHMDHLQGLGFFAPLYNPDIEVHIWGPGSTTLTLWARLSRYMSPPLFPVRLRDLPCTLQLHEVPCRDATIGPFSISANFVCHPGPTVGYRISTPEAVLTYIPDHEPALGARPFPLNKEWTSGAALAAGVDLLIHDAQYSQAEYPEHIGWGHSSIPQTFAFAALAEVKHLVPFHHDPRHTDDDLDRLIPATLHDLQPGFAVTPAAEGTTFMLPEQ